MAILMFAISGIALGFVLRIGWGLAGRTGLGGNGH